MTNSILGQTRRDGYNHGFSQAMQVRTDDAYQRGCEDARAAAPKRLRWLFIGCLIGAILSVFIA